MFSIAKASFDWLKTWKSVPVLSWVKAADLYKAGNYEQAAKLYEKGLLKNPNHKAGSCARLDLAYCLFRLGKYELAKEHLQAVINRTPSLREAYVRLARLQVWSGQNMDAAWTLRRALREVGPDAEIIGEYLIAVLDNGGPGYLLREALASLKKLNREEKQHQKLEIAAAKLAIFRGELKEGRAKLGRLASGLEAPFEAVMAYAEALLEEGRVAHARQQLRRALMVAPQHPRVLSLFAFSYLRNGPFYNAEYAAQLALSACQNSGWQSPKELHILAQAYSAVGRSSEALLVAHRAKEAGSKLLGNYHDVRTIDVMIADLSKTAEM